MSKTIRPRQSYAQQFLALAQRAADPTPAPAPAPAVEVLDAPRSPATAPAVVTIDMPAAAPVVYAFTPMNEDGPTGPTVYGALVQKQAGRTVLRVVRRDQREEDMEVHPADGTLQEHAGYIWELADLNARAQKSWEDAQATAQEDDDEDAGSEDAAPAEQNRAPAERPAPAAGAPAAQTLLARCHQIASALTELCTKQGQVWTVQPCERVREYVELRAESPDGALRLQVELDKGRLQITPLYGPELSRHLPDRSKRAKADITVDAARSISAITSEITGRCLSPYLCNLAAARQRKAAHEATVARRLQVTGRLAALLGRTLTDGHRRDIDQGNHVELWTRHEDAPLGNLRVRMRDGDWVELDISTKGPQALDRAEAIIAAAQGEAAAPAADAGTLSALQQELAQVRAELELAQRQAQAASEAQDTLRAQAEALARQVEDLRAELAQRPAAPPRAEGKPLLHLVEDVAVPEAPAAPEAEAVAPEAEAEPTYVCLCGTECRDALHLEHHAQTCWHCKPHGPSGKKLVCTCGRKCRDQAHFDKHVSYFSQPAPRREKAAAEQAAA